MTVQKWRAVALAHAVKCGTDANDFYTDQTHEIYYVAPIMVALACKKTGQVSHTSLYNCKYWWSLEDDSKAKEALEKAWSESSKPKVSANAGSAKGAKPVNF